jgi:hypothetical protein
MKMKIVLTILALVLLGARINATTITYTYDNTASATSSTGSCGPYASYSEGDYTIKQSGASSGTIQSQNLPKTDYGTEVFTSPANDPGLTSWASGTWTIHVNVTTASSNMLWVGTCVFSTSAVLVGSTTGQSIDLSTTGLKTMTVSGSSESVPSTAQVQVDLIFQNSASNGPSRHITYSTGGANDTVSTPIDNGVIPPSCPATLTLLGVGCE